MSLDLKVISSRLCVVSPVCRVACVSCRLCVASPVCRVAYVSCRLCVVSPVCRFACVSCGIYIITTFSLFVRLSACVSIDYAVIHKREYLFYGCPRVAVLVLWES